MEDSIPKMDDSEAAKVSDSAYSNSGSKMSHSSKSTHSRSQSSGSSGYGGLASTKWGTASQPPEKRTKENESIQKIQTQIEGQDEETKIESDYQPTGQQLEEPANKDSEKNGCDYFAQILSSEAEYSTEKGSESMDIATSEGDSYKKEELRGAVVPNNPSGPGVYVTTGFSCVVSMHDGVVMHTTSSLTASLGFPKEMWIGRSFIDFVHPRDRDTFASQITTGLTTFTNVVTTKVPEKDIRPIVANVEADSSMACRIRRYRNLSTAYAVKDGVITYMPFLLKLTLKSIKDHEGKVTYLVIQAKQILSAFKEANEVWSKSVPFEMRHTANGILQHIDKESVQYLGYIPQDIVNTDALLLYHRDDLFYMTKVYETIVKEGGMARSKTYRLKAQNGDYLKVETEWTSFINPWSKKLEFVTGKHHIIEGPANPDVFQKSSETENKSKHSDEENNRAQGLRDSIVRILNEALTKPGEQAKIHMSRRAQELASLMETLMEDQPKFDEDLRIDVNAVDNGYYEQDTVMLGGISPHHDFNDNKSSTGTQLSYNHLSYNETLQRYFESQEQFSLDDVCNTVAGEHLLVSKERMYSSPAPPSYVDEMSSDSSVMIRSSPVPCASSCKRLSESLLTKHNQSMEKVMMKAYRENKSNTSTGDKEKCYEEKQKRIDHLARCNAAYQPTVTTVKPRSQGVKRSSTCLSSSEGGERKQLCSSPTRHGRRRNLAIAITEPVPATETSKPSTTVTETEPASTWPTTSGNGSYFMGISVPQQMTFLGPVPGMFPVCYAPTGLMSATPLSSPQAPVGNGLPQSVPCMMYGQAMYGTPFMYPNYMHMPYAMDPGPSVEKPGQSTITPLELASSNYEEACKRDLAVGPVQKRPKDLKEYERRVQTKVTYTRTTMGQCGPITDALNRGSAANSMNSESMKGERLSSDMQSSAERLSVESTEAVPESQLQRATNQKSTEGNRNSDDPSDRTDGESSYSSFYSSFFKTESGSATDSGDAGKRTFKLPQLTTATVSETVVALNKTPRRKMEPPWMENVQNTPELANEYQVTPRGLKEALEADRKRMQKLEQSVEVNEQLQQLYREMQLQGVAERLSLEEALSSSSGSSGGSSGSAEENAVTTVRKNKVHRKREYSKLVMIYEEDAPFPPSKSGALLAPLPPSDATV